MKNWNGVKNLKNIKNETLIIWGDQDKAYNFDQVEILNNNIANSNLKIIKDFDLPESFITSKAEAKELGVEEELINLKAI